MSNMALLVLKRLASRTSLIYSATYLVPIRLLQDVKFYQALSDMWMSMHLNRLRMGIRISSVRDFLGTWAACGK
jgi:hypothetical protein